MAVKRPILSDAKKEVPRNDLFDLIEKRLYTNNLFATFCKILSPRKFSQNKPPEGEGRK